MKNSCILALMLLGGCASLSESTLSYSSDFKFKVPHKLTSGGTFFYAEGLSLKTADGRVLSGSVIDRYADSLPDDFDMSYYPKYIFGLKDLDKTKEYYEVFYQTQNLMREKYNLNNTAVIHGNGWIFYSLCNLDECLGFVAKQNHTESVFMISADGFSHSAFMSLVEGGLHVK